MQRSWIENFFKAFPVVCIYIYHHFLLSWTLNSFKFFEVNHMTNKLKNRFKQVCELMRMYFLIDLLCKNEPA